MECKNCKSPIQEKGGFLSSSNKQKSFSDETFNFIRRYSDHPENSFCGVCFDGIYPAAISRCSNLIDSIKKQIDEFQEMIPILSIQNLPKWDYEIKSIVTGQSTMGTGFLTEFKSSWGDLLGVESKSINLKITEGESNCFKQMRSKAIALGGNAIIGVDIDYSEMGGLKGMVMVCSAGTVINVKNYTIFEKEFAELNEKLPELKKQYSELLPDIKLIKKITHS